MSKNFSANDWRLILRLAARDLRGGFKGLRIFMASIALGVAAIVAIGALSDSLLAAFSKQGQALTGGDLSVSRGQRKLGLDERMSLERLGAVSEIASLRAMARAPSGETALVEIKAVDAAYPLVGEVLTDPPGDFRQGLILRDGFFGVYVDPALLARLSLQIGDKMSIGSARFMIVGTIAREPDRMSLGLSFGPRALMTLEGLAASGLSGPTALTRWSARILLSPPASDAQTAAAARDVARAFPDAGWDVRERGAASPQIAQNIERYAQFMSLIGLISLIIGGVGIVGAVEAFVARKRETLAILKVLGASGAKIFVIVLLEMMIVSMFGATAGVAIGLSTPYLAAVFIDPAQLPFEPILSYRSAINGFGLGFLSALAFVAAPAGRAHDVPVSVLFRPDHAAPPTRLRLSYVCAAIAAYGALGAAIYFVSIDKKAALILLAAVGALTLVLRWVAALIGVSAGYAAKSNNFVLRMAMANLRRRASTTQPFVAGLGLGLTLLVAVASLDSVIHKELAPGANARTPDFFFLDVRGAEAEAFKALVQKLRPQGAIEEAPLLRGRIVKIGAQRVEEWKAEQRSDNSAAWTLEGDRGVTFANAQPANSRLVAGRWWSENYAGPPLVSVDGDVARGLGLKVGDAITVNVMGRPITAEIANLRHVDWRSLGMNFVLVFSSNAFAGAPHSVLMTLHTPGGAKRDDDLLRALARTYPGVTAISVREALDAASALMSKIALSARALAGVTLAAAALVIGGAAAASQRLRLYDIVIMRALGATRKTILSVYAIEFLFVGLATSAFAFLSGSFLAKNLVERLMRLNFAWDWLSAVYALALGSGAAMALGLGSALIALRQKPAKILRDL